MVTVTFGVSAKTAIIPFGGRASPLTTLERANHTSTTQHRRRHLD